MERIPTVGAGPVPWSGAVSPQVCYESSSSEESLVKFEEEASLVGRYLGCSVAARFDAAASDGFGNLSLIHI